MAGDGGYGGNGSVYWSIHHRSAGGPEQLRNKRNLASPDPEHWIDLGVPGKVPAKMGTEINGHDPTRAADIGDGTGDFKVALLFSTLPFHGRDDILVMCFAVPPATVPDRFLDAHSALLIYRPHHILRVRDGQFRVVPIDHEAARRCVRLGELQKTLACLDAAP